MTTTPDVYSPHGTAEAIAVDDPNHRMNKINRFLEITEGIIKKALELGHIDTPEGDLNPVLHDIYIAADDRRHDESSKALLEELDSLPGILGKGRLVNPEDLGGIARVQGPDKEGRIRVLVDDTLNTAKL